MSTSLKKRKDGLRSARWFNRDDLRSFGHRSRMMQLGYSEGDFLNKPIIGVMNTWSDLSTCHAHFRDRAQDVKRGVAQAGGFAVELPALSLDESFLKPTSMLYRNMLAMETEEMIRAHPLDGVVLMGGCDKTTPGLVMGALSAGVPMIFLPAGPMLRGNYAGKILALTGRRVANPDLFNLLVEAPRSFIVSDDPAEFDRQLKRVTEMLIEEVSSQLRRTKRAIG